MIKRTYEVNEDYIKKYDFFLFYGANEGFKKEKASEILLNLKKESIYKYDEKEILNDQTNFFEKILSHSLFEEEKVIIINNCTDKIFILLNEIIDKKIKDLKIIFEAKTLEKKSKLRSFFEKNKDTICVAFYEDTDEILAEISRNYLKKYKIRISQEELNIILNKSNKSREVLKNELNKIHLYSLSGKKIDLGKILKLTNLTENFSISELVNNSLAMNIKKTNYILNENNFEHGDCILIIRTFINRTLRIIKLHKEYKKFNNLEQAINNYKPPIFWKEKSIVKQQVKNWEPYDLKRAIYKFNKIELEIKKDVNNSINILKDFIINKYYSKS